MLTVAYVCRPNGWSLHNFGLSLVAPMAAYGIDVRVVTTGEWHAAPAPADVVLMAHTDFHRPAFPYRDYTGVLAAVVHDPDEVSTFYDRLDWARWPLHAAPKFGVYDRIATCSAEMEAVLRDRYGLPVWHASSFPHNAAAVSAACEVARPPGGRARLLSTAYGPVRATWLEMVRRLGRPRFWATDERGRASMRQLRSAAVRMHRKNVPWLARLGRAFARDARADVDFRYGRRLVQLSETAYLGRLTGSDVYVCTSMMEGGPFPVMEAVLAGLAVITTPVGQTGAWVRHGENGFVVRSYAEAEAAVRVYLDHPDVRCAHRARSRAIAASKHPDGAGWAAFFRGDRAPARLSLPDM